jgi:hypothetical protein
VTFTRLLSVAIFCLISLGVRAQSPGGLGISLVTDGTNIVSGTRQMVFTGGGATVSSGGTGTGIVNVAITAGSGNVVGPSSSTINDIAAYSGATGKAILDSAVPISSLALQGAANVFTTTQTVTPSIAVSSLATSAATGAAGIQVPVTNPTGLLVGQVATGTSIPSSPPNQVMMVSGGTAPINGTAAQAVATGASYIPLAAATVSAVFPWEAISDPTSSALASNTFIIGSSGGGAQATATCPCSGAISQNVITVASGGTSFPVGDLVQDLTTVSVPTDSRVIASTATTITIDHNIATNVIGTSDNIVGNPTVRLSAVTIAPIVLGDTIPISPAFYLQYPTTAPLTSGQTVNFGALTATLTGGISARSTLDFGNAGITWNGQPALSFSGGVTVSQPGFYGSVIKLGLGAGGSVGPYDTLSIYEGWGAAANLIVDSTANGSQSTVVGGLAANLVVDATNLNLFGHSDLAHCLGGAIPGITGNGENYCSNMSLFGTDNYIQSLLAHDDVSMTTRSSNTYSNGYQILTMGSGMFEGSTTTLAAGLLDHDDAVFGFGSVLGTASGYGATTPIIDIIVIGDAIAPNATTLNDGVVIGEPKGATQTANAMTTDSAFAIVGNGAGHALNGSSSASLFGDDACPVATNTGGITCIGAKTGGTHAGVSTAAGILLISDGVQTVDTLADNTGHFTNLVNGLEATTAAPTISSGFGTGATVPVGGTSFVFEVNVGTGGSASSGIVAFTNAMSHGYGCDAHDTTSLATMDTRATITTTGTITLTNYAVGGTTPTAWNASDVILVKCLGV